MMWEHLAEARLVERVGDRGRLLPFPSECPGSVAGLARSFITFIFNHGLQLLLQAFMPATNVQMQRDVAARLLVNHLLPLIKR